MMPADESSPDSTSLSSSVFIVSEREYQREPLVRIPKVDGNETKYRCCCCCHVWVCTLLVGVAELILLLVNLIFTAAAYATQTSGDHRPNAHINSIFLLLRSERSLTVGVLGAAIGLVVVGLLIHGVLKQKHRFLAPHLVAQLLAALASIIVAVLFAVGSTRVSKSSEHESETSGRDSWTYVETLFNRRFTNHQSVGISVVLTCLAILQCCFFVVVLRCYVYLKEVNKRVGSGIYMPMVAVKGGVPNA